MSDEITRVCDCCGARSLCPCRSGSRVSDAGRIYVIFNVTRTAPGQVTSMDRLRIDVEERSPGLLFYRVVQIDAQESAKAKRARKAARTGASRYARQRALSGSITVGEVS